MSDDLISTGEAAKMLQVAPQTLRNWADHGLLAVAYTSPAGTRKFRKSDIQALLENGNQLSSDIGTNQCN